MQKSSSTALARQQLTPARNTARGHSSHTMSHGHEQVPRSGDRRPHRPSGKIGEAADDAPEAGPVSTPGTQVPLSCDRRTAGRSPQ
jgi:hypothetical protein